MSETQFENEKLKKWLQDNLRIILSIVVVVVIAGLIHSYSKRTESQQLASVDTEETELESELSELEEQLAELGIEEEVDEESGEVLIDEKTEGEEEAIVEIESEPETVVETEITEQPADEPQEEPETIKPVIEEEPTPDPEPIQEQPKQEATPVQSEQHDGQETEGSFIETATTGEGLTHLARHALADYLEKNPDSQLTAEHKIYIEDYLRKNVNNVNGIRVGTSVEFSKGLIKTSIDQAKNLNEGQLNNLKKYTSKVSAI